MKKLMMVALLGVAVAMVGCKHRPPQDAAGRAAWMQAKLAKHLELDAAQKEKLLPVLLALSAEREGWRGEGQALVGELKAQVASETFDAATLNKSLAQREAHLTRSRSVLVTELAKFHALLKPEQRKKAAEALGKLEDRMQKWGPHS